MPFSKTFFATLRSMRRSLLFWICAASMLLFIARAAFLSDWDSIPAVHDYLHSFLINAAIMPGGIEGNVWLIISVVACVDILGLRKRRIKDICDVTGASSAAFFCGKLCAYAVIGVLLWAVCSFAYFGLYIINAGLSGTGYGFAEVLWMLAQRVFFVSIPTVVLFLSLSLLITVRFKTPVAGIASAIVFKMSGLLVPELRYDTTSFGAYTFFGEYVFQPSEGIVGYWNFHGIHNVTEAASWESSHPNGFRDFVLSLVITFAFSAILLTLSYFRYRKLKDK